MTYIRLVDMGIMLTSKACELSATMRNRSGGVDSLQAADLDSEEVFYTVLLSWALA